MMARLGELPSANGRPSSEATRMPGRSSPATFCEQRAQAVPAGKEGGGKQGQERKSMAHQGLLRQHDAVCLRCFASSVPVKTGDGASMLSVFGSSAG